MLDCDLNSCSSPTSYVFFFFPYRFHELDLKKSLRENLMFKTVVEYPELHVVIGEHCEEYRSRNPGTA